MSAEYMLKMELLRSSREELTAKRKEIERRIQVREATAAEYSAIALQSAKQKWKSVRASAVAAKRQNEEFIREIHETKKKIDEVYMRTTQKLWPGDNQMEVEKARYLHKVGEMYPAWQERMQSVRVQTLRELEEKKRAIEKRRYLAKKSFETERTLDDLIKQTSHEVALAENLEKNEALERDVLRNQSVVQAVHMDETIREHALGARMYMQEQAQRELCNPQQVSRGVQERIFETFSPRNAVSAMREATNAVTIVNHPDNNAEDEMNRRPRRAQSIVVPRSQFVDTRPGDYCGDSDFDDPSHRFGLGHGTTNNRDNDERPFAPAPINVQSRSHPSPPHLAARSSVRAAPSPAPSNPSRVAPITGAEVTVAPRFSSAEEPLTSAGEQTSTHHGVQVAAPQVTTSTLYEERPQGSMGVAKGPGVLHGSGMATSAVVENSTPTHPPSQPEETAPGIRLVHPTMDDTAKSSPVPGHKPLESPLVGEVASPPQAPPQVESCSPPATDKPVVLAQADSFSTPVVESKPSSTNSRPIDSSDEAVDQPQGDRSMDLSLNFINSIDSNQSSLMEFSVGKYLQTPEKHTIKTTSSIEHSKPVQGLHAEVDSSADSGLESPATAQTVSDRRDRSPLNTISDAQARIKPTGLSFAKPDSLVLSSLESISEFGSPGATQDTMLDSVSDLGSPQPTQNPVDSKESVVKESDALQDIQESDEELQESVVAPLSMPERFKALTALVARVEAGAAEGDQVNASLGGDTPLDTKRELLRMAVTGRKAQINFFGSDVCFELVMELARELGPVLFPAKAFEGIMNDQKMKKVHQNGKEKEADLWKAFATHIKQLSEIKTMAVGTLVDHFADAFLQYDAANQRSQRKLREFLYSLCGATESTTKKEPPASSSSASPARSTPQIDPAIQQRTASQVPTAPQIPTLLQTAFLQQSSPATPKTYGIASSSSRKKSSTDDLLKSMANSPTKLSQKLIRGGKMGDYSEFEEEDEVNLENLIGSKSHRMAAPVANTARGRSSTARGGVSKRGADADDFDVDF